LKKLQPSLSRPLADAGAKHDGATLCQSLVATRSDLKGVGKGHGMAKVVRLRLSTFRVLVY
jgi:hypothetical protein